MKHGDPLSARPHSHPLDYGNPRFSCVPSRAILCSESTHLRSKNSCRVADSASLRSLTLLVLRVTSTHTSLRLPCLSSGDVEDRPPSAAYPSRPRLPVRRDHDIDPSSLGIRTVTSIPAAIETSSLRRCQRVRLADGSHLLQTLTENFRPSHHLVRFIENFRPSHHRPKYCLCSHHRETHSSYWENNRADDA